MCLFFKQLREARDLLLFKSDRLLGHSLSEVDWPYFELIFQHTKSFCLDWTVSYYDESSISGMMDAFAQIGVSATKVKYVRLVQVK
jgi:hypothetical protein